uniref:60S ribosome subunit biogenesis protein NIP7 homolog n=1 Tax=Aureoumbra lagunensis TaxID=44058 RepID=A0A7S3JT61_9STRA
MRPLTDDELRSLIEKLMKFVGKNIEKILKHPREAHCFRVQKDRIYYVSETLLKLSTNFARKQLLALGTCFAKVTHSGRIHLQITCLDFLAEYSQHKVWLKANAEMSFLYGNHVTKAGLGRITDAAPQYAGVVVYNLQNTPLGFGVLAHPTEKCKDLDPTANVVLHQADVGEYLRMEDTMF